MPCCGKARKQFQEKVNQSKIPITPLNQTIQIQQPLTRQERIKLRQEKIKKRAERIALRKSRIAARALRNSPTNIM